MGFVLVLQGMRQNLNGRLSILDHRLPEKLAGLTNTG
jgi:hypothetical protein